MKKLNLLKMILAGAVFPMLFLTACDAPSNSDTSVVYDENAASSSSNATPATDTSKNTDTEKEREEARKKAEEESKKNDEDGKDDGKSEDASPDVEIDENYIRGFDVSALDYWENDYAPSYDWADEKWYDTDGSQKDFFEILKSHGINTVRIRVWVDPSEENTASIISDSSWPANTSGDGLWKNGDNTTSRAVSMSKRAKEAGLKVMIDLHYSDYWTDPGKQVIPAAWQSVTSADEMAQKISDYTSSVLTALKNENVSPDYVQAGNEIDSGILLHTSYSSTSGASLASESISGKRDGNNFSKYIKAACDAVRNFDENIKIILHVTNAKPQQVMAKISGADYDIISLSYYPWESSHGKIKNLKDNISALKSTYGKTVIIGEISAHWKYNAGSYDADLAYAASHLLDPTTESIYSDIECETVQNEGSDVLIVKGSVENQTAIFRHVIEESVESGAGGIVAWGGERREDWKYAFFSWEGQAFSSLDVFNIKEN